MDNFYDVIIVGAGISGVDAAYRLQERCPDHSYTILEARDELGGTWDLFRYPGIRSDSDLHTFGFPFRPWKENRAIVDGPSIKRYMTETVEEYGIDRKIQYRHKLEAANWSSDQQAWSLSVDASGQAKQFHGRFLYFCTGYYDYHEALPAEIPGIKTFQGPKIHPQFWPQDLDYSGKKIVVIGSGATAITLIPSLAQKADFVTMLQRSPSYVVALPQENALDRMIRRFVPSTWTFKVLRMKFIMTSWLFFKWCRTFPQAGRRALKTGAAQQLPKGYPIEPNFEPNYDPWQQRLCISPNGDFYTAIRNGKADVVTATIKEITRDSIILQNSDKVLRPDIIITATGLKMSMAGGARISVDNEPVRVADKYVWKGIMLEGLPNAAIAIGYTNASWTLGADATAHFVTRLLNEMKAKGYSSAVPTVADHADLHSEPMLNLKSTYIVRAKGDLPKAGDKAPWLPRSFYFRDLWEAKSGALTDLHFSRIST